MEKRVSHAVKGHAEKGSKYAFAVFSFPRTEKCNKLQRAFRLFWALFWKTGEISGGKNVKAHAGLSGLRPRQQYATSGTGLKCDIWTC